MDFGDIDNGDGWHEALPQDPYAKRARHISMLIYLSWIVSFVLILIIVRKIWIFHNANRSVVNAALQRKPLDTKGKEKIKKEI